MKVKNNNKIQFFNWNFKYLYLKENNMERINEPIYLIDLKVEVNIILENNYLLDYLEIAYNRNPNIKKSKVFNFRVP